MIKLKSVALLALGFTAVMANAADPLTVQGGTVHFQGSIVNSPCVVDVNSADQTVNLGQFQSSNFVKTGDTSSPVNFDINLISCDASTLSNAAIKFKGPTIEGEDQILSPLATQAADTIAGGVGVQILQDSNILDVNGIGSSEPVALLDGTNKLSFQARYISTSDDVTVGSANAMADFTVTYN